MTYTTMIAGNGAKIIPIYSSRGEVDALLFYPYVFNRQGEWIGWVTSDRQIYSVHGHHVGWLSKDPRILRKPSTAHLEARTPPPAPERILPPASFPLAPLMPELQMGTLDVLMECPELLPPVDLGELREDMD